jgi:DNA-binding response OmpR family regulator
VHDPQHHAKHVLYVDDERALVAVSVRGLSLYGYRVTGFSDPRQALESFRAEPQAYDAVVTDLSMPSLPGLSLVHELRALRSAVPVIALSGVVTEEDRARCAQCGVSTVLAKPFSLERLARALDSVLSPPESKPVMT